MSPHSVNPRHLEKTNLQAIGHERDLTKETQLSNFLENLNVSNSSNNVAANSFTMGDGCKEFDNTLCHSSVKQNLSTTVLKDNCTESERHCSEVYPGHKKKKRILEVKKLMECFLFNIYDFFFSISNLMFNFHEGKAKELRDVRNVTLITSSNHTITLNLVMVSILT